MLKGRNKLAAFPRVMTKPMKQLRKTPSRGVHSAAPLNGFKLLAPRGFRDFRSLRLRAVMAPKVVVIERLKVFPSGNYRGSRHVQRDGANLVVSEPGLSHSF